MRKAIYLFCSFFVCLCLSAQTATISGRVTEDSKNGLPQVTIAAPAATGIATLSDSAGYYRLDLPAGTYDISYTYIGKETQKITITVVAGETHQQNVVLRDNTKAMDQIVVSGSRYEKKLSEEVVSMDVMKGSTLNEQNITDLENGVQKIPGVTIADGQANIRSGSGWSYGAGSRVAVLYDGLPVTTADANDAKWSAIPMEDIEQVEVIKGAASALYGSGAMNGIINAISAWPTDKPYTKIQTYFGFYANPPEGDMRWWGPKRIQYFTGANVVDRRKIGRVDLVIGAGYTNDRGYLDSSDASDAHLNVKLRWRPKKIPGLNLGVNAVGYYSWGKNFFIWDNIGAPGYQPLPGTITIYHDGRYMVDPYVNYYDQRGNKFSFKYRYLNSTNINTTGQGSIGHKNFGEFQYTHVMKKIDMTLIAGVVAEYDIAHAPAGSSDSASLIGNHNQINTAVYAQLDKRFFKTLNVTLGGRWEYFNTDRDTLSPVTGRYGVVGRSNSLGDLKYPLGRIGANWQVARATYLRASGGMAFRYPALAELYIHTYVGPLGVYDNPGLKPEKGYSSELAVKQGFSIGNGWTGYGDAALFANFYNNMMEFTFGQFGPASAPDYGLGFSSQNIGNTRILGTEITAGIQGKVKKLHVSFTAGYTFTDPRALDWNKRLTLINQSGDTIMPYIRQFGPGFRIMNDANHDPVTNKDSSFLTYAMTSTSPTNLLKYRSRHQLKLILDLSLQRWGLNVDYQYLSYQQNIDYAFVSPLFQLTSSAFAGLAIYRMQKAAAGNKGDHILNLAVSYKPINNLKLAVIVKNILNTEYMARPGMYQAPRNFTLQLSYTL